LAMGFPSWPRNLTLSELVIITKAPQVICKTLIVNSISLNRKFNRYSTTFGPPIYTRKLQSVIKSLSCVKIIGANQYPTLI
jgi:hypothetical protein